MRRHLQKGAATVSRIWIAKIFPNFFLGLSPHKAFLPFAAQRKRSKNLRNAGSEIRLFETPRSYVRTAWATRGVRLSSALAERITALEKGGAPRSTIRPGIVGE
jgi:hypothetical protein